MSAVFLYVKTKKSFGHGPEPIRRRFSIAANNEMLVNEKIPEMELRVIGEDGSQMGIMTTSAAQALADEADLDLVIIAPKAQPPVGKIMNYGKYRYEQIKHQKEAKKNQKVIELKEMRLSATIDLHDLEVKAKNVSKFLADGNKVKVSIRFKGRQVTHTDQGLNVMETFLTLLDNAAVEKPAKMEGRNMFMILAPKA